MCACGPKLATRPASSGENPCPQVVSFPVAGRSRAADLPCGARRSCGVPGRVPVGPSLAQGRHSVGPHTPSSRPSFLCRCHSGSRERGLEKCHGGVPLVRVCPGLLTACHFRSRVSFPILPLCSLGQVPVSFLFCSLLCPLGLHRACHPQCDGAWSGGRTGRLSLPPNPKPSVPALPLRGGKGSVRNSGPLVPAVWASLVLLPPSSQERGGIFPVASTQGQQLGGLH